jgi:hypothetical protein
MSRESALVFALSAMIAAVPAGAQSLQCPGGTPVNIATQDVCQKAVDLFQYMAPQLATAITGGNAVLGQGGTLGGIGHFSAGARINVIIGSIPQVQDPAVRPRLTGASPQQTFPTTDSPIPMSALDAAIGLYKGIPFPLTNVGGIDLLLSATFVPEINRDAVAIEPDNPVHLGYGVRVGALQESLIVPGVAFTFATRDLPTLSMTGSALGATLNVTDASVKTSEWRVVASKSLILFGLALGLGQDFYKSTATATGTIGGQTSNPVHLEQSMTRTSGFLDLSVNLPLLKLVGEIGQVSGGSAPEIYNNFEGKGVVASRLYGSLGLRLSW